ncbi:zf-MYND-domain-containing protein, partial [Atractiella rhizophila]
MRGDNFTTSAAGRAAVVITGQLYDRRALDNTSLVPLINSLTRLQSLTSTSPRIREILTHDGGLERLMDLVDGCFKDAKRMSVWSWTLAFQCICNVGIRGTEQVRQKLVEAGVLPLVVCIMENRSRATQLSAHPSQSSDSSVHRVNVPETEQGEEDEDSPSISLLQLSPSTSDDYSIRDEEILLCLQLLAYLSKYPHVRATFHRPSPLTPPDPMAPANAKFTFRPVKEDRNVIQFPPEIQRWAGVIMRNACRKDDARGGIRQCANMACGKWESSPREFAKCRRCRKAKYCSKTCQSKAWSKGHRMWC